MGWKVSIQGRTKLRAHNPVNLFSDILRRWTKLSKSCVTTERVQRVHPGQRNKCCLSSFNDTADVFIPGPVIRLVFLTQHEYSPKTVTQVRVSKLSSNNYLHPLIDEVLE